MLIFILDILMWAYVVYFRIIPYVQERRGRVNSSSDSHSAFDEVEELQITYTYNWRSHYQSYRYNYSVTSKSGDWDMDGGVTAGEKTPEAALRAVKRACKTRINRRGKEIRQQRIIDSNRIVKDVVRVKA
jgi:hypothetical protein